MKEQVNFFFSSRRRHTRSGLWVIFSLSVAIYSASADTILLKSRETVKGQIASESDLSVTISTETSTGKTDKTIAKSEIVGMTLASPAENKPEAMDDEVPIGYELSKAEGDVSAAGLQNQYAMYYIIVLS